MRIVTWCCDWCMQKSQNEDYVQKNWDDVENELLCRPCITARAEALSAAKSMRIRETQQRSVDVANPSGSDPNG